MSFLLNFLSPEMWQGQQGQQNSARMAPLPTVKKMRAGPSPFGNFGGALQQSPTPVLSTGQKFLKGLQTVGRYGLQAARGYAGEPGQGNGMAPIPVLGAFDDGGEVPESGPYQLEGGEIVIPRRMAPAVAATVGVPSGPRTITMAPIPLARPGEAQVEPIPNYDPRNPPRYTPVNQPEKEFSGADPRHVPLDGNAAVNLRSGTPARRRLETTGAIPPANRMAAMPAPRALRLYDNPQPDPPDANKMAPMVGRPIGSFGGSLDYTQPVRPGGLAEDGTANMTTGMAPVPVTPIGGPAQDKLLRDLEQGFQPPHMGTGQKILRDILGVAAGVAVGGAHHPDEAPVLAESAMRGPEDRARQAWDQRIQGETGAANLERQQQDQRAALPDYKFANVKGHLYALDPHTGEPVRDYGPTETEAKVKEVQADDQGNAVAVFEDGTTRPLGYKVQQKPEKPERFSSPFEAFAFGTPAEKQAAQQFLDLEKRLGARYDKPDEVEQRYQLYKSDPDAYKAMFGNPGGAQDEAQASRMLAYFDRQKKQVVDDWTLDEATKAQRLQEIEDLEKPYLNAAAPQSPQPNAGGGSAPSGGRITVVSPDGHKGTIPRSQLEAAQAKGYKLAPQ